MNQIFYAPANLNNTGYISGGIGDEIEGIMIDSDTTLVPTDNRYNELYEIKNELLKHLNGDADYSVLGIDEKFEGERVDDELIKLFNQFVVKFKKHQTELIDTENILLKELEKNRQDVKLIDTMMENVKILQKDYPGETDVTEKMNELGKSIRDNSKIGETRKNYITARKVINSDFNFIRYINRFNKNNTCVFCYSNSVDVFFDPCGHTCCRECSDNLSDSKRCFICRTSVHNVKKLYFS
tara:strand:- start:174 stop:893 length:720 start_codon:yes stop_codon:yes gene_type:complete